MPCKWLENRPIILCESFERKLTDNILRNLGWRRMCIELLTCLVADECIFIYICQSLNGDILKKKSTTNLFPSKRLDLFILQYVFSRRIMEIKRLNLSKNRLSISIRMKPFMSTVNEQFSGK